MQGLYPDHPGMTRWEWAMAGAKFVSEIEDFIEAACKVMKRERLRRFGETRLHSNEWAMAELRQSLQPDVIAGLAAQLRGQIAPRMAEAATFDAVDDVEEAIQVAFRYMPKDCYAAARARIRRAAKAAEREELRKQVPAFLVAYEALLDAEDELLRASNADPYDDVGFMKFMEERHERMAAADAEAERLDAVPEVLEMRVRRMEEAFERSKERKARRAEMTRAIRANQMMYAPRRGGRGRG